eukprot:6197584-Pleurochrysis_carterae.AAC.3
MGQNFSAVSSVRQGMCAYNCSHGHVRLCVRTGKTLLHGSKPSPPGSPGYLYSSRHLRVQDKTRAMLFLKLYRRLRGREQTLEERPRESFGKRVRMPARRSRP